MCGIVGYINKKGFSSSDQLHDTVVRMARSIQHRGPDSEGSWIDSESQIAMAHRRLAILDLSVEGHQPMRSQNGRYMIVFNGEIYNYKKLRSELELKHTEIVRQLRGNSDTEIILACIEVWGLETAVQRFVGMFSFALWDRKLKRLFLVRDRLGEKPLYYGWNQDVFFFGSELKAFRMHPEFIPNINRNALTQYLRHMYVPAPYSIYDSIYKLIPGSILTMNISDYTYTISSYWSVERTIEVGKQAPFRGSESEAVEHLERLLKDSIGQQMVADVPLGAFLSGGIDSSTVVAIMQSQSSRPVKTFTIGFHEEGYNEAQYAKEIANYLGTDHSELYVSPREAIDVIPLLPTLFDEPFSDSSQIPTYLLAKLAKQQVTVSLSGDGGDELFGGYTRYMTTNDRWNKINSIPLIGRKGISNAIRMLSPDGWNKNSRLVTQWIGKIGTVPIGDKMHIWADMLAERDSAKFYRQVISHWRTGGSIVVGGEEPVTIYDSGYSKQMLSYYEAMMYFDSIAYLPDDILVKVDRSSMGVSLESRIPMLDHRIVEFAWKIPMSMKIREGKGKWLLRQVLYKYIPQSMMDRPKKGFGVPMAMWLRGPLREWAEELLDERRLNRQGYFQVAPIRRKWLEHQSGKWDWHGYLWDILMFQAWLEKETNPIESITR